MKPILETYNNRATDGLSGDRYTAYELRSVREYQSPDGTRFMEPVTEECDMEDDEPGGMACGPALVGLYGRLTKGGVEHIADYRSAGDAREVLYRMGVIESADAPA